jgi:hypothetical protein
MLTRIQGGRVIDPGHLDTIADIFVRENEIVEIVKEGQKEATAPVSKIINASGKMDIKKGLRSIGKWPNKQSIPKTREQLWRQILPIFW